MIISNIFDHLKFLTNMYKNVQVNYKRIYAGLANM